MTLESLITTTYDLLSGGDHGGFQLHITENLKPCLQSLQPNASKERLRLVKLTEESLFVKLDLSHCHGLNPLNYKKGMDANNNIILKVVDCVGKALLHAMGSEPDCEDKNLKLHLNLSQNVLSGRSILLCDLQKAPLIDPKVLGAIASVDFRQTFISSRGLENMFLLSTVRKICLDFCSEVKTIIENDRKVMPHVQKISMVGTAIFFTQENFHNLIKKFPHLKSFDFTQRISDSQQQTKLLGVLDPITQKTIINPLLLSCGHVLGMDAYQQHDSCGAIETQTARFTPLMTRIRKDTHQQWSAYLIDYKRKKLKKHLYMHQPCGVLFNRETVKKLFKMAFEPEDLDHKLRGKNCPVCEIKGNIFGIRNIKLQPIYPLLQKSSLDEAIPTMADLDAN